MCKMGFSNCVNCVALLIDYIKLSDVCSVYLIFKCYLDYFHSENNFYFEHGFFLITIK